MQKIRNWINFYPFSDVSALDAPEIREVAKNVYCVANSCAHAYCLMSEDGSALMIDYGGLMNQGLIQAHMQKGGEGNRFIPHSIELLEERGLKKVEAFTPTHYHDDHLAGLPYLIREHGVELWAYEKIVPHLENSRRELLGCSIPESFRVDRVFEENELVKWHEYEFRIRYTPGHCDYHMSLFLEHDNERIVISGDVLFNSGRKDAEGEIMPHWNLIYMNKAKAEDHHKSAKLLADFDPTWVCPGHGYPFRMNQKVLKNFVDDTAKIKNHLSPFTGNRSLTEAMSPHWCQALPFEQQVTIGMPFKVKVRVSNYRESSLNGKVRLATPQGWQVKPSERKLHVHAGASAEHSFEVVIVENHSGKLPFVPYGIEMELDGRDQGEVSQGQVEIVG